MDRGVLRLLKVVIVILIIFSSIIYIQKIDAIEDSYNLSVSNNESLKALDNSNLPNGIYRDPISSNNFIVNSQDNNIDVFGGRYIIEFQDEPVVVKENEIKKLADDNENKIESMSYINPLKYGYMLFSTRESDIPNQISDYRKNIEDNREKIKDSIINKLNKKNIITITGNAILNPDDLNVVGEFENTYNGIAVSNLNPDDVEKIKTIDGVKNVIPDQIDKIKIILKKN